MKYIIISLIQLLFSIIDLKLQKLKIYSLLRKTFLPHTENIANFAVYRFALILAKEGGVIVPETNSG